MTLVDATTDTVVATLTDGARIGVATLAGRALTIVAEAAPGGALVGLIGGMRIDFQSGQAVRVENAAPHALFGDNGKGDFNPGFALAPGGYGIDLDVFSSAGAHGTLLASVDLDFPVA